MISIEKLIEEAVRDNPKGWVLKAVRSGNRISYEDVDINDIPKFINENIPKETEKLAQDAANENKGIYLHGPAGIGKTYLLYGLMRRRRLERERCIFINVPMWLAELRQRMDGGINNHGLGLEFWINKDVTSNKIMFIDDMAVEKSTDWNDEILYRLINYRSENMLETHFASNLTLQELSEKKGDRI